MYKVAIKKKFAAKHYLIGGDWGSENEVHTHDYEVEVQLEGTDLDKDGFLVDIVEIEDKLEHQISVYSNRVLNDLPAFHGLNPSIEHFARILSLDLASNITASNITAITVKIWENDCAWASHRHNR